MPTDPRAAPAPPRQTTVVIITRDRCESLLRTLAKLRALNGPVPITVVDNASRDGTVAVVEQRWPDVEVVALERNLGAPGRTVGVERATTPFVAFADDDSWWDAGALRRAEETLARHPDVAVLSARVVVGDEGVDDETAAAMRRSPLGRREGLPGPSVLGFMACGAVVRRDAYLAVGGFNELLEFYGEEELLAIDLREAGWELCYDDGLVARHHPDAPRDVRARRTRALRNEVLATWLRRPWPVVARATGRLAVRALTDRAARAAAVELAARAPAAARGRRRLQGDTERDLRLLRLAPEGR